jgi:hypothetical protein
LISGLTLKSNDLKQALKNWVGVLYGIFAILVLTPCVGFVTQQIPFKPKEFTEGNLHLLTLFRWEATCRTSVKRFFGPWNYPKDVRT